MPELSIIIPVYNTPQSSLLRCCNSVAAMDPQLTYEVLLIDDGSGPEIEAFCTEYLRSHPDFHYIRQENGGASAARNTGISHAKGTYLTFLDADDTLLPACIQPDLLQADWDLILFDMLLNQNNSDTLWATLSQPAGTVEDLTTPLICTKNLNSPCAKLFRRSIISEHRLRFDTGFVTGEDWNFVCDYTRHCSTVYYCAEPVYRYYRDGSTSTGRLARYPDVMIRNYLSMYARKLQMGQSREDASRLDAIAAADLVETLFNTAAELLLLKLLTPERKHTIRDAVRQASQAFTPETPRKTRMKASVIGKHFYLLRPLAQLRNLYLKHKH